MIIMVQYIGIKIEGFDPKTKKAIQGNGIVHIFTEKDEGIWLSEDRGMYLPVAIIDGAMSLGFECEFFDTINYLEEKGYLNEDSQHIKAEYEHIHDMVDEANNWIEDHCIIPDYYCIGYTYNGDYGMEYQGMNLNDFSIIQQTILEQLIQDNVISENMEYSDALCDIKSGEFLKYDDIIQLIDEYFDNLINIDIDTKEEP